ncbi:GNAT family N-acetyltransferase [Amycolatopsis sp. NPDC023774]|uniref:GNAT family N-acetyltransferase n=1 Tax=Amycolatopsis sp. NPDC023774 TaxID=3155015 RepID=UPI0034070C65
MRTAGLTVAGLAERELLDRASDELAASMLEPLPAAQRERLLAAMADVEKLVVASLVRIEIIDPRSPDARYCLRSYFEELGRRFEAGFDPAQSISAGNDEMTLPSGLLLVAARQGSPVGCGALKLHADTGIAEIKRMWVFETVRGLGCSITWHRRPPPAAFTRCGWRRTRHSSNARRFSETAGFTEVDAFNDQSHAHHWCQRDLHQA